MTPPKRPCEFPAKRSSSGFQRTSAACSTQHGAAHVAEKHLGHEGSSNGNTDIYSFNCTDAKYMSIKCHMDT